MLSFIFKHETHSGKWKKDGKNYHLHHVFLKIVLFLYFFFNIFDYTQENKHLFFQSHFVTIILISPLQAARCYWLMVQLLAWLLQIYLTIVGWNACVILAVVPECTLYLTRNVELTKIRLCHQTKHSMLHDVANSTTDWGTLKFINSSS